MTEQEIINVLKENKTKGIAYLFLPEEVWKWIGENLNNPKLLYLAPNGKWESFSETDFDDFDNIVFALPDYYQVKKEPSGEWVEFKINKNGYFTAYDVDDNDHQISLSFGWHQWSEFLDCSCKHGLDFTTFGGWQYENCDTWFMCPMMSEKGVSYHNTDRKKDYVGAVPTKIRFWKESR